MLGEWFLREGGIVIQWWLVVTLMGLTALPLCVRLLKGLPDKGYGLSRSVGLLLIAFVFWMLTVMGFTPNTIGSMLLAWLIVLVTGLVAYFSGERIDWKAYWRENRRVVLVTEVLFVVLLFSWAIFRAYQNDTATTEKPMDLMFMSSIMRTEAFPPQDAWMSGYAISYYHFGYLMAAMLGKLTGVSSGITFGMTLALWFALSGVNAFSVGYGVVRARAKQADTPEFAPLPSKSASIIVGLLAAFMLVWMSNWQPLLIEAPYQAGYGDAGYYEYWGVQDRTTPPAVSPNSEALINPSSWSYWWWFRASRVLTDYRLDGTPIGIQPIDEFPNFSFLLGDTHPHVLALPFGMMALGLALNMLLVGRNPRWWELLFYAITIGSLIFLNTWDILASWGAFIGADALRRIIRSRGAFTLSDMAGVATTAFAFAVTALVAYSPFLYSFRSQAAGIVPNALYPTYFPQFFLMFAPFLLLLGAFVMLEGWRGRREGRMNWGIAWGGVGVVLFMLLVIMLFGMVVYNSDPNLQGGAQGFVNALGGWQSAIGLWIERRITYLPTTLLLVLVMVVVVARLFAKPSANADLDANEPMPYATPNGFILLLVAIGATLALIPEFLYLRDNFDTRINTIFKFYYQIWGLWSIAGAYAVYVLCVDMGARVLSNPSLSTDGELLVFSEKPKGAFVGDGRVLRYVALGMTVFIVISGALYGVFGVYSRAITEGRRAGETLTLDGTQGMTLTRDDYAVVQCLDAFVGNQQTVVAEAVRDAYASHYGRVGSITGIPIVIGWENHQRQWRGATYNATAGTRTADLETLYNTLRWELAVEILQKYNIGYIMMGQTERNQYQVTGEDKFIDHLEVICESGSSRVYRVGADIAKDLPLNQ